MKRYLLSLISGAAVLIIVGCSSAPPSTPATADSAVGTDSESASPAQPPDEGASAEADVPTSDGSSQTESPEQNDAGGLDGDPARLAECGLSEDDLAYMQRDWERVVDSVGRNDHAEYADAFIDELTSIQDQGQDCPARQSLALFLAVANELADSASDSPDYDLYREAADQGNAWLEELGVSADRLAAG